MLLRERVAVGGQPTGISATYACLYKHDVCPAVIVEIVGKDGCVCRNESIGDIGCKLPSKCAVSVVQCEIKLGVTGRIHDEVGQSVAVEVAHVDVCLVLDVAAGDVGG